jgi:peptidyl-prolyl cis-trans isomerase SurA
MNSLKHLLTILTFSAMAMPALAQDPAATLFTYSNNKVTVEEFERYFLKNINFSNQPMNADKVREDLDLYIKFKLKIQDAHDAGMDTLKTYLQEVEMFRQQLAKGYLYDREVTETLIKEAYNRLAEEVEVSHILVMVKPNASSADTLLAWQKIKGIYDRITAGTSKFEDEAKNSDDPGTKDIGGNLGYMTALQVVYPFENVAYSSAMGVVSMPFRTDFGYHILKVTNKRANRGDVRLRHILLRVGLTAEGTEEAQKKKIDEIYAKIKSGQATVGEMARNFSEDYNSRNNGTGGEMDFLNVTMFIGDLDRQRLVENGFNLAKDGDYAEPFRTSLGWHIIQRIEVRPLASFEQMRSRLKEQVQNNSRAQKSVDALVMKVKQENGYKDYPENMNALIYSLDTNFAKGKFVASSLPEFTLGSVTQGGKKGKVYIKPNSRKTPLKPLPLFVLAGEEYTVEQFATYLESSIKPFSGSNMDYVNGIFKEWVNSRCVIYQDKHLEEKSPEFKHLYQEFREGILMFSRMQQKVWDRANEDTVGLKAYHEANKQKYMWNDRFDCEVYLCADKKMMSAVEKQIKKGLSPDSIRRVHTRKSKISMDYRVGKYEQTDTFLFPTGKILTALFSNPEYRLKEGKTYKLNQMGSQWVVVKVNRFIPSEPKLFDECKGHAANDYQQYLETEWINDLMKRYPYQVNQQVLGQLSERLTK